MNGERVLNGFVSRRAGILFSAGSLCGCNVSELLKLLLAIPLMTIVVSPLDRPCLDWTREGGLLEEGRELSYAFANKVSVLLKWLIPAW